MSRARAICPANRVTVRYGLRQIRRFRSTPAMNEWLPAETAVEARNGFATGIDLDALIGISDIAECEMSEEPFFCAFAWAGAPKPVDWHARQPSQ